jgi:hypothetical protein
MGRQWLHAKREVANLKKGQAVGKLVKEIMVAAKTGGPDLEGNARLHAAVEKARKASVTRDVIERASEHPWVLIDSEEVAQQFVGKRVQVDAPGDVLGEHELHNNTTTIRGVIGSHLQTAGTSAISWRDRGNVRLRIVDGDLS